MNALWPLSDNNLADLRTWPTRHGGLLRVVVVLLIPVAVVRMAYGWWRLVAMPPPEGAYDLRLLYAAVQQWFAGLPVYTYIDHSGYPPASLVMLWPLLGWVGEWQARWLWAITALIALGGFALLLIKATDVRTRAERLVVVLGLISIYPTGILIGNGQFALHLLPILILGLVLIKPERQPTWQTDVVAALLLLLALVKPSLTIPFYWLVLFLPGRIRPMTLVGSGYVLLTILAAPFQREPLWAQFHDLFVWDSFAVSTHGNADVAFWLRFFGLQGTIMFASLGILLIFGLWVSKNRHVDFWVLMGVGAIVARMWTYHMMYDDLLIVLPMIALFRIARNDSLADNRNVIAGLLLVITWAALEAPASLARLPLPWNLVYNVGQTLIWLVDLFFLIDCSRRQKKARLISTALNRDQQQSVTGSLAELTR